ncbi:MAG: hypothetical protein AAGF67_05420, partial [Verrucomicrobiota bacterium]
LLRRDDLVTLFHFGENTIPLGERDLIWRSSDEEDSGNRLLLQPFETVLYREDPPQSGNAT